jgi:hypothetical protein
MKHWKYLDVKNLGVKKEKAPKYYLLLVPVFLVVGYLAVLVLFS